MYLINIVHRSTVQLSQDVKEAKKMADVTSGIEAMSNPNQDTSVSARRGATVSSPPGTGECLHISHCACL